MSKLITPPRILWATVDGLAQALDVNYAASAWVPQWQPITDATEITLLVEVGVAGGAPTSIEIVPRISFDGGVTSHIACGMEWQAAGFSAFGGMQIRPPIAALGFGIVDLNWALPTIPMPGGCWLAFWAKRTAGAAANTLLLRMADGAVG